MDESHDMLAICVVDLSPELREALDAFYAALSPPLRAEFPYLLARVEAETAELADTTWGAAMERVLAQSRPLASANGSGDSARN